MLKKSSNGGYEPEVYAHELAIDKLRTFLTTFALDEKVDRPDPLASEQGANQEQRAGERAQPTLAEIKVNNLTAQNFEEEVNKVERMVLVHLTTDERVPTFEPVQEKFTYIPTSIRLNFIGDSLSTSNLTALSQKMRPLLKKS